MAKTVTKYSIFVASPSDLEDERTAVDEVVKELNISYGAAKNILIEVLKWETHAAPGFSKGHTQDLIDEDIGNDYDLFLGMIWKRFGTPTEKASSGTEQEFLNAVERFKLNNSDVQILFYFKDATPKSLADIDAAQLLKIEEFKKLVRSENALTWNFDSIENLKTYLRMHIPRRIESVSDKLGVKNRIEESLVDKIEDEDLDDLGWIEYSELYENLIGDSSNSLGKIAESTGWIGEEMRSKTEELTRAIQSPNPSTQILNAIMTRTAKLMNEYTSRIEIEIPIFYDNFTEGIAAGSKLINLSEDFDTALEDLEESLDAIVGLKTAIPGSIESMLSFYESIKEFPRIQKDINQAKRKLMIQLEDLIDKLRKALDLTEVFYSEIVSKIENLRNH